MRRFWVSLTTDNRQPTTRLPAIALALTLGASAEAQDPKSEAPKVEAPPKTVKVADLTNRYRFSERYTLRDEPSASGEIGPYRVAVVEVARDTVDTLQGAPKRMELTRQSIFVERPAELGGLGGVAATARTFERYRAQPDDPARMMGPKPLEGLSTVIRPRLGDLPLILSLTADRRLTEYEYEVAARQVVVAQLSAILPVHAVRPGDTWKVPRRGAQALLGDPGVQGDTLVGKFAELRKEVDGPRMVAQVVVSGKATAGTGDSTVNAEALFTFRPESTLKGFSTAPSFPPRPTEDVIEARGGITELRLARLANVLLPGPGRLRFRSNREVTLHRQLALGPDAARPPRVEPLPAVTEANTWLDYLEPSGRFRFQHPQDFLPPDRGPVAPLEAGAATLVRARREGTDMLQVEFAARTLGLDDLKKKLAAKYALTRQEVIPGDEQWLPEADWPRMKVYRIEAALKVEAPKPGAAPGPSRIHFDGYLLQFGQSAGILAVATTSRDSVAPFRREVEQLLRTIQVDPGRPTGD